MATRLYLEESDFGVPPVTPAFDSSWSQTTSAIRRWLSRSKLSTAFVTTSISENTATSPFDVLVAQFISEPISAQTISGTVKGQIRVSEANADADYKAQIVIWVMKPDGTSRGTLLAKDTSALSSEFVTSLTNRKFPLAAVSPATLTNVTSVAGDRIVVEVGYRSHNSHTTARNGSFRFGSAGASDLAENETATTEDNPWIELSGTITFEAEETRVTQGISETVVGVTSPGTRVTQAIAEVSVAVPSPQVHVTQAMVEVVVEADFGWWDTGLVDERWLPGGS
jgi:hypothetical protein